jgi:hypothetical protein
MMEHLFSGLIKGSFNRFVKDYASKGVDDI